MHLDRSVMIARWRQCTPHASLDQPDSTYTMASWSVQPFLHSSQQRVPILYNGRPLFLSKLPLRMGDLNPHLICGDSLHIPESNPISIWIGSAVFAGLTIMTDHVTPSVTMAASAYVVLWCSLIILHNVLANAVTLSHHKHCARSEG